MLAPPWDVYARDALVCETCWFQWMDGERQIDGWPTLDDVPDELRRLAKEAILSDPEKHNQGALEEMLSEDSTTQLIGRRGDGI